MKKWEEQQRLKHYNKKITNAKSTVTKKSPKTTVVEKAIKTPVRNITSATSKKSNQIGDYYEHEKTDLNNIPLYRLLRMYNLQQYAKELISRGYGYRLQKFNFMTMQGLNTLFEEIKVLPGHKTKLLSLIDYIGEIMPDMSQNYSQISGGESVNQSYQNYHNISKTAVPKNTRSNSQKIQLGNSFSSNTNQRNRPVSANTYAYSGGPISSQQKQRKQNLSHSSQKENTNMYKNFKKKENMKLYSDSEDSQMQSQQQQLYEQYDQFEQYDQDQYEENYNNYYDQDEGLEIYQQKLENEFNDYYSNDNMQQQQSQQQQQQNDHLNQFKSQQLYEDSQQYNEEFEQFDNNDNVYLNEEAQQHLQEIGIDYFSDKEKNDEFCNTLHNIMKKYQTGDTQEQFYGKHLIQQQEQHSNSQQNNNNNSNSNVTYNFMDSQDFSQQQQKKEQEEQSYYQEHEEVEIDEDYEYHKVKEDSGLIVSYANEKKEEKKPVQPAKKQNNFIEQNKNNLKKQQKSSNTQQQYQQQQQIIQQNKENSKKQVNKQQQVQKLQQIQQNKSNIQTEKEQLNKELKKQKKAQDDIILVPEINSNNEIETQFRQTKILRNIEKHVVKDGEGKDLDIKNVNLELEKIKNLYISYDSGKLTSTLVNLDLEEMCFCLASAVEKHLEYFQKKMPQLPGRQVMTQSQLADIQEMEEEGGSSKFNSQQKQYQQNQIKKSQLTQSKLPQKSQVKSQLNPKSFLKKTQMNTQQSQVSENYNMIDEPSQLLENRSEPEIDVNNYYKNQFLKNQSEIQDILKQSLLIQQNDPNNNRKNSSNLQYSQDLLLSQPQNFYEMDEVQSDNEGEEETQQQQSQQQQKQQQQLKQSKKQSSSHFNCSGNQSLANRLSEKDAYECDMDLSEDEDEIQIQQSQKAPGDSMTVSRLEKEYAELQKETEEFELHQNELKKQLQENQGQQFEMKESQQSENMLYDSRLDQSLEDISYQKAEESYDDSTNLQEDYTRSQITNSRHHDKQSILSMQKSTLSLQESSLNFSMISQYTSVEKGKQPQLCYQKNKLLFDKTFNEEAEDKLVSIPNKQLIQNYCKNIVITSKMEKEVIIISLVYIERLLLSSLQGLTGQNWRRVLFTSLIMGSKIWDDQSFENDNFAQAFDTYTTRQINEFERVFLDFLDYRLQVKSTEYAKYYFILRTFAEKNKKSFPLRPLDIPTILRLQNGSNKAEGQLKEQYMDPLNKSF